MPQLTSQTPLRFQSAWGLYWSPQPISFQTCGSLWKPSNWKWYSNTITILYYKKGRRKCHSVEQILPLYMILKKRDKRHTFKRSSNTPFRSKKWHCLSFCHPLHWITTCCWLTLLIKLAHWGSDTPRLRAHSAVISRFGVCSAHLSPLPHSDKDTGHPQQNILIKSFRLWTPLKVELHFLRRHMSHLKTLFMKSAPLSSSLPRSWLWNRMFFENQPTLLRHLTIKYYQCNQLLSNSSL